MWSRKKISPRRKQVRENIAARRFSAIAKFLSSNILLSGLFLFVFVAVAILLLALDGDADAPGFRSYADIFSLAAIVLLTAMAMAFYVHHYQPEIIEELTRSAALAGLLTVLLGLTRVIAIFDEMSYLSVGMAVSCAVILTIVHNQRFAIGMGVFFAVLLCFAAGAAPTLGLYLTMLAGVVTCCFLLREVRTRMKLLEVSAMASLAVLAAALASGFLSDLPREQVWTNGIKATGITILVGVILQGLLPVIERAFRVATSMTLLDYSDANQPLLKRLAMEAPGTFSHSLLIGSLAEAAAEAIGANGLLARVGAYYHDIGKINKPAYFIENQLGRASRHEQLSPTMSQLIIVGHVKDGIEMAKEYGLPRVLWQFIETHHGTTLVEYFYNEAKKRLDDRQGSISENEFRYAGPTPRTKEAAIVMLCDAVEGAVRSLAEVTPMRIETVVHNMAMKRLQDGQFDQCDMTLRELSTIEDRLSKALAAHYHGRIAYPKAPDAPEGKPANGNGKSNGGGEGEKQAGDSPKSQSPETSEIPPETADKPDGGPS